MEYHSYISFNTYSIIWKTYLNASRIFFAVIIVRVPYSRLIYISELVIILITSVLITSLSPIKMMVSLVFTGLCLESKQMIVTVCRGGGGDSNQKCSFSGTASNLLN